MPTPTQIAAHLDRVLRADRHPAERGGVLRGGGREVRRLLLALDVAEAERALADGPADAVLLHRWWGHEHAPTLAPLAVLGYHLPFDDRMTVGDNPRLAALLHMTAAEPIVADGRAIGMAGDVPECLTTEMTALIGEAFGGVEAVVAGGDVVRRVAAVGAMTPALVHEARRRGADLYLTGQLRAPARDAVAGAGIAVVAVGHRRAERWGLTCLAGVLRERWAGLEVRCPRPGGGA